MPNPSELERQKQEEEEARLNAWVHDEQSAKIEQLEQHLRDVGIQFGAMATELADVRITMKKIATVNIQLMRGLKELDETCVRKPTG